MSPPERASYMTLASTNCWVLFAGSGGEGATTGLWQEFEFNNTFTHICKLELA